MGITELDMTPPGTAPVKVDNARNGHAEISFGNVNLKAGIKGDVRYFIQLGAFRDTVPDHLRRRIRDQWVENRQADASG